MSDDLKSMLSNVPQLPQRQDSLRSQLADLAVIANRLGLYDASTFLVRTNERAKRPITKFRR